jgi:hypothetical protein
MNLPELIHNIIYMCVFCDDVDLVCEPVRYDLNLEAVVADVLARVHFGPSPPPSKGTILPAVGFTRKMKET